MTGKRMRGRAAWSVVDRGLLFKRIRELEGVVDIYDVGRVVEHLRELYREYGCKKLIPFTQCVEKSLEAYRHRQRRLEAKQEGFDDEEGTNEATPSSRSPKRFKVRPGRSSSSSSVGSADEEVFDMEVKPEFDLLKSAIRESYSKSRPKPVGSLPKREEEVQEETGLASPVSSRPGDGRGSELGGCEERSGPMFKDFGGIEKIIDELIMEAVIPLLHPQLPMSFGVRPLTGILLYGPPGCGKTMLAQAIANETGVPFYMISATDVISGVSGVSEENIRELFKKAHRTAPSIIFIDEIDAIGSKRENLQREMEKRIVTELMTCMDEWHQARRAAASNLEEGLTQKKQGHVLVIGATNRPDAVDPALRRPGRLNREIFLAPPDENARREILSVLTGKLKLDGTLDLVKIARATAGFVGTDLVELVNKAGNLAMKKVLNRRRFETPAESTEVQKTPWWRQPWNPDEIEKHCISTVHFEEAVKLVQPSSRREGFSTVPDVKWEDVGGLDSLRREFDRHIIQRLKNPELYEEFGLTQEVGFLLYGPPGCGKTLIAKAVANEADANFIHIKGPELLNKYVGESELAVRMLFNRARTCSPCILFFDEIDALTMSRGNHSDSVADRLLTQLLIELDGADQRRGVFVIGATNRPEAVDPAIRRPGRLGKIMYVPLPSPEERVLILKTLCRKKPLAADVDLAAIAHHCENFSGADLSSLVYEASVLAAEEKKESIDQGSPPSFIKTSHLEQARKEITPSVSLKRREHYDGLSKYLKPASMEASR